ncbi:MAG: PAS domain S-box protein, partial [Ignavibacteria bacterium]|nr:PAS domain S-box protein [Ignavibacteria bacterium]
MKRTEEFMQLSQICLDNAEDIIFWFDSDGIIKYANQSACSILEYSLEELLKFGAYDIVGPHTIENWANYWDELRVKGSLTYDAYLKTKSGEILPYEKNANYLEIDGKQYNFSFLRNIADRIKHETALANEKERLAVTLRSIGDGVIVTDIQGKITLMNKSAEHLTGYFLDEVLGMNTSEVYKVLDEKTKLPLNEILASSFNNGYVTENMKNKILLSPDGNERIISESIAPIRDNKSETIGYVVVFRDITEKVVFEKERETAEKLRSIGVLAVGIAHDFNNILTAIVGNLALAENQIELNNNQKILEIIKNTEKAAFR